MPSLDLTSVRTRIVYGLKSAAALCLVAPRAFSRSLSTRGRTRVSPLGAARVTAEAAVDESFTAVAHVVSSRRQAWLLERSRDDVERAATLLSGIEPRQFHAAPPAPETWQVESRGFGPLRHRVLTFNSCYEPPPELPGRERWLAREPNRRVPVRMLVHDDRPRPWVMCVHGARQGQPSDIAVFRARRLHRAGFNVALPVLPVHGARALRTSATFPTLDLLDNLHAITQGVSDLRQTLAWIRDQGATAIAVHGLSLGGHLAAMLVGLEPGIDVAVAGVPMSSVVGVIGAHVSRAITGDPDVAAYLAGEPATVLDRLMSPFEVSPLVARAGLHVYGGYGDGMSTFAQSEALWRHWGRPAHCWYAGGHVGAVWSRDVRRFVERALQPLAPEPDLLVAEAAS